MKRRSDSEKKRVAKKLAAMVLTNPDGPTWLRPRPSTSTAIAQETEILRRMLERRFAKPTAIDRAQYVGLAIENIRGRVGSVVADAVGARMREDGEEIADVVTQPIEPLVVMEAS